MAFLTDTDKQRVAEAIRLAEIKTSGEFVAVVTRASDHYAVVPILVAALVALPLPGLLWLLDATLGATRALELQLLVFMALLLVMQWSPLKLALVPRRIKHAHARRLAREQFYAQGLHHTQHRTGVLLFVSIAERYVEIIADEGIHGRVPEGHWDQVVAEFITQVRAGQVVEGFLHAVAACGEQLATHFPRADDDVNELPNRLVEI